MADAKTTPAPNGATGVLVLADGSIIWGRGFGAADREDARVAPEPLDRSLLAHRTDFT